MAKRKEISVEEYRKQNIDSAIKDIQRMLALNTLPLNPTRTFVVGERVLWGAHEEVYVRVIHENGLYYTVESIHHDKEGKSIEHMFSRRTKNR